MKVSLMRCAPKGLYPLVPSRSDFNKEKEKWYILWVRDLVRRI